MERRVQKTASPAVVGLFDATMVVMGGIIGAGIFVNPAVVAASVQTPLHCSARGSSAAPSALIGAFVYAELSRRGPSPAASTSTCATPTIRAVAFLYGWALLLVIQTGGMAVCAMTFARYLGEPRRVARGRRRAGGSGAGGTDRR